MGNITEHAAPPPAFSGARRTARPGQQECPIRIWSCVLVMHRFPRDCILGGGGGGWGLLVEIANLQISHIPPPAPRVPPPKATRAPYILHTNKTFTGEKSLSYPLLAPCFCTVGLLSFPLSSPLSLDLSLHRLRSAYQLLRNQAPRPSSATMCRDCGVSGVSTHNASKCNTQKHCLTHTTFECKSPRVENLVKNNAGNGPEAIYIYTHSSLTICMYTHLYIAI